MQVYEKTLHYFHELSRIPRKSHHEEKVREWLISWAQLHNWEFQEDEIGNLLVIAKTPFPPEKGRSDKFTPSNEGGKMSRGGGKIEGKMGGCLLGEENRNKNGGFGTCNAVCLQSHMDMVCVSENPEHSWECMGVEICEEGGILKGKGTTLGADNGIGVAAMMAIAEKEDRPDLELLFTMGEEVGLVGAHHLELPITAPHGINLDWSDSTSIGIGCGGTLLISCKTQPKKLRKKGTLMSISIGGFEGGHSGVDINKKQGNAILELLKIILENENIYGISDIKGGDADNAIPRNARATFFSLSEIKELKSWLEKKEKSLQRKYKNTDIRLSVKIKEDEGHPCFEKSILSAIHKIGSGMKKSLPDNTPLSSWNLGKIRLKEDKFTWCYFLRTNLPHGINPMKKKIMNTLHHICTKNEITTKKNPLHCELSCETPVWKTEENSFIKNILHTINTHGHKNHTPIPAVTTHATVEVGLLAEKYPHTQWISIGATCHHMHTTREHIYLQDLEEFCERLEKIITIYN